MMKTVTSEAAKISETFTQGVFRGLISSALHKPVEIDFMAWSKVGKVINAYIYNDSLMVEMEIEDCIDINNLYGVPSWCVEDDGPAFLNSIGLTYNPKQTELQPLRLHTTQTQEK